MMDNNFIKGFEKVAKLKKAVNTFIPTFRRTGGKVLKGINTRNTKRQFKRGRKFKVDSKKRVVKRSGREERMDSTSSRFRDKPFI